MIVVSGGLLLLTTPSVVAVAQEAPAAGDRMVQVIPGTDVSLTLSRIPGGTTLLGSAEDEVGRELDEGPQRTIVLQPFWMSIHEVTHDQFAIFRSRRLDSDTSTAGDGSFDADAVSRPSPPYEDPAHGMGQGNHPASGMTQWAALQYARWLSLKTGRLFRLPTEAEWEHACRAGTGDTSPFADDIDRSAWYAANSGDAFQPVGQKAPNAWGLYDMAGNVAEWTLDEYTANAYELIGHEAIDPWVRPASEHPRTVRGGAFDDEPAQLRCADRLESTLRWKRRDPQLPKSRWWNTDSPHVGFRLVSPDREYTIEEIRAYWQDLLQS
jgi:formylglycine-generating enzyme required for sulfatase activity